MMNLKSSEGGFAFALHGGFCFVLYALANFLEIFYFYGLIFLIFEYSTPFGNTTWFVRHILTPSKIKFPIWINVITKIFFGLTFVVARLIFGIYWSRDFFYNCWARLCLPETPTEFKLLMCIYLIGNVALNSLNFYWFGKLIYWFFYKRKG
eukprot:TRINITY_DN1866_c0_g1_i1.p1 TRINITY_DN1866_c0_g1~~TRINITY_DN1866_c0_g1_i1.p1  ORF type:complete len:151 (-),score=12.83 TRINITY_DN1866_c0_g1_i1:130-582(-)